MLSELFRPMSLPRGRALASLVFAAFAFLAFAGAVSFSAGSPDTLGLAAAPFWAGFFAFHFVVFLGAALLGAFPRLARPRFKVAWLSLTACTAAAGLLWWDLQRPADAPLILGGWMRYLLAVAVLIAGCCYSQLAEDWMDDEAASGNDEPDS